MQTNKALSFTFASVAQWIEHPPPKGRVVGSIPTGGANKGTENYYRDLARLSEFKISIFVR